MSKELNLFSLETKDVPAAKISTQSTDEKKSSSLFDNILSNLKDETKSKEAASVSNKPAKPATQQTTQEPVKQTIDQNSETQIQIKNKQNRPKDIKTAKSVETTDNKEPKNNNTKTENSTLSLLDRMMMEAANKMNNNESSNENTKERVLKTPMDNLVTAVSKDIPKEIKSEQKTVTNNKTLQNKTDNLEMKPVAENKELSKVDESKNVQNEKSLFDLLTKDLKTNDVKSDVVVKTNQNIDEELITQDTKKNTQAAEKKDINVSIKEQIIPSSENKQSFDVLSQDTMNKTDGVKIVPKEVIKETVKQSVSDEKSLNTDIKQNLKEYVLPIDNDKNQKSEVTIETKEDNSKNEILKQSTSKENVTFLEKETTVKKSFNTETQTTKTVEKIVIKNENIANELSKINTNITETKVNISKEEIEKLPNQVEIKKPEVKESKEKSLLDKLVDESKQFIKNTNKVEVSKTNENPLKQTLEKSLDPLVTNMYLSSQKKNLNDASILTVATGKTMASEATSVKEIEKSAQFLDLGLEDTEVTVKMQELEKHTKLNILDKLAFAKTVIKQDIIKSSSEIVSNQTTATSTTNTAVLENETTVQLNVSSANITNIESRIIGARQQMGSMMSDVARNMYLNYKPPVTAFRMNLNPGTLGSIAIVMKSDKENGLTISLNMSNNATLDSFVDNQVSLRTALAKNFNAETNFTLDFNMQQQNENNSGSNSQQNNQNRSSHEETAIMQNMANSDNQESTQSDYM